MKMTPEQAGLTLRTVIVDDLHTGLSEIAYRADFTPALILKGFEPPEIDAAVKYCKEKGWVTDAPGGLRLLTTQIK